MERRYILEPGKSELKFCVTHQVYGHRKGIHLSELNKVGHGVVETEVMYLKHLVVCPEPCRS